MLQKEITKPQNLLDESGKLTESGWSREPMLEYDRTDVKNSFFRVKEWDHYVVYNDQYALALTVAEYGYFAMATAMLLDFRGEMRCYVKSKIKLFSLGRLNMPSSTRAGDANYGDRRLGLKFSRSSNKRFIKSEFMSFHDGKLLNVSITLDNPDVNTIAVSSEIPEKAGAFAYCQKDIGMTASGFVKFGGEEFNFSEDNSYCCLDWGRGVLPRENRWFWSTMSTKIEGKSFGINFGSGLGDTSQGSENALFYDGKLHKISALSVQAPKNPMEQPWKFYTKDKKLQLTFTPFLNGTEKKGFTKFRMEQKLLFGRFNGRVKLEGGQELKIQDLPGFTHWVNNYF